MWARCLVFLLIACLLPACASKHRQTKRATVLPPVPMVQDRLLAPFSHIAVEGVMNIKLQTGCKKTQVTLHGSKNDLAKVYTLVKNQMLVIRFTVMPKFGNVTADICTRQLRSFRYRGAGVVVGHNIHSRLLDLNIRNSERTVLNGTSINLNKLVADGPGYIEVTGVRSPYLQIVVLKGNPKIKLRGIMRLAMLKAKSGFLDLYWVTNDILNISAFGTANMSLAGIANRLELDLHGSSRFNGRYLRVSRTFVKTFDNAVAEINSIDRQHTLASGASDIQFFHIPVLKSDFMACNGAVLDMRDWDQPFLQEYNRYNKDAPIGDWP